MIDILDKISQDSIKAFGISPITLPISDVRTALQSGLINTVATSPVGAIVLQWHTQIRYVTNIPLAYLHAVLAIDKKKFLKIAEHDQNITTQIMTKAMKEIGIQNKDDNIKAIQALKNQGITFINPSQKAIKEWRSAARNASQKMIDSGVLPRKIVNQMNMYLTDFYSKTQNDN